MGYLGLIRFARADLRYRAATIALLGVALVIASASFVLLTASVRTSEAKVEGAVASNFVTSYDILVRPPGSRSELERTANLVRPNFETGIYGGISETQWRTIQRIPGVDVAAPVAYVGFTSMFGQFRLDATDYVNPDPKDQLLRLRTTWSTNHGLSQYPGPILYLYVTSTSGGCTDKWIVSGPASTPFDETGPKAAYLECYERASGRSSPQRYTVIANPQYSMLVAGVDPGQEDALVGMSHAVTEGRYLTPSDIDGHRDGANVMPMLAPDRTYQDEALSVHVESVELPAGQTYARLLDGPLDNNADPQPANAAYKRVTPLPATPLGSFAVPYDTLYRNHIRALQEPFKASLEVFHPGFDTYFQSGPVSYSGSDRGGGARTLKPVVVENDPDIWLRPPGTGGGFQIVAPDNQDTGFRTLTPKAALPKNDAFGVVPEVVGSFDPNRLAKRGGLNEVPLQLYAPPLVVGADTASRAALGGQPLGPTANLAGYVSQPASLVTTLKGATAMLGTYFEGGNSAAPISVIRVRVAGVTGVDKNSIERIKRVAAAVSDSTGLTVDIMAGSSPQPQTVALPAGRFGQPALTVTEGWSVKGVSVVIRKAVDRKSAALFTLILVVTGTFLATTAWTSVRGRRAEIGMLRTMGWRPRHIFATIIGQLAAVGALAGLIGAAVAFALIRALSLDLPTTRALLVVPLAVVLAVLAGLAPAVQAARGTPMQAITQQVASTTRSRKVHGMTSLAMSNLQRRPGRTLAATIGLIIGVAAVVVLVALTLAYQDVVTGSSLADFARSATRSVDYLAIGLVLLLASLAIANVVALSIRERAPEFATLLGTGWKRRHVIGLVAREAVLMGIFAGVVGATLGVAVGSLTGAPIATLLRVGAVAAILGLLPAGIAGLIPAVAGTRRNVAHALSEE